MQDFNFIKPDNLDEVCNLLIRYKDKAKLIAGGTDLMISLRKELLPVSIDDIIDISGLKELSYIREEEKYIRIGAGITYEQITHNKIIKKEAPLLSKAAGLVGSPQIRNRGTIAGNIITASPAADIIPVLMVLKANLVIRKGLEKREISLREIFRGLNKVDIKSDEILCEIYFEKLPSNAKSEFLKLTRRNAVDKARMNIAAIVQQDKERIITDIRISVGSLTPIPERFKYAEDQLLGKIPNEKLLLKAAKEISKEMINKSGYRWSTEYKKPVVESLIIRTLKEITEV